MLTLAAVAGSVRAGRNVPLGPDWALVASVTGHQPDPAAWLWEQTGEDREPLPRMVLVAAIAAAHDFRAGPVLATLLMSAVAAGLILAAAALRRGPTRFRDIFLPLLLLHPGHWTGLGSAHTLAGALAAALTFVLLVGVLFDPDLRTPRVAFAVVTALVLLPLTGTAGLLLALVMSPWVAHCGWRHWPPRYPWVPPAAGPGLLGGVLVMVLVIGLYFAGYDRAPWTFPEPAPLPALRGTLSVFAAAAGPAAIRWAALSLPLIGAVIVGTCGVLVATMLRLHEDARERARALASFVAAFAVVALLFGWREAAHPASAASPTWALLATPAAAAAFFIWELYGPRALAIGVQMALLAALLVLAVPNARIAREWREHYHAGTDALVRDIAAGLGAADVAARHGAFAGAEKPGSLTTQMLRLQRARIGPFGAMTRRAMTR